MPTVVVYCHFDKVEELRRDLRIKSQELEAKNAAANDKLKKMVKDQQEAEKKKVHTGNTYRILQQNTIVMKANSKQRYSSDIFSSKIIDPTLLLFR